MKKTLTAMALATSILPIQKSNAETDTDLLDLNTDDVVHSETNDKGKTLNINKDSMSATVYKENAFTINDEGEKVDTLKVGDKLQILKRISDQPFTKVNYNGRASFIANDFISTQTVSSSSGLEFKLNSFAKVINVKSNDTLNVRSTDTTSGKILFTLKPNAGVNVTEMTKNGWYKIEYYGNYGFVNSNYIELINPSIEGTTFNGYAQLTSKVSAKELPSSKSKSLFELPANAGVYTTRKTSNNWYEIKFNNKIGFVNSSNLKILSHEDPNKPNFTVTPLDNIWSKIVGASKVPGKKYPATTSSTICDLVNGAGVYITGETSNGWYQIKYYDKTVYVPKDNVQQIKPATPETNPPVTPEEPKPPVEESKPDFTVTDFKIDGIVYDVASNDTLNIREYPDASSKLVTSIPNNTRVNVTGKTSNNWYRLDIDGKVGYANSRYIKEYVPETTQYKVIKENINLRLSPSWGGEVYQMVRVGEILDVISINGDWASIYKDKKTVYAPADYLGSLDYVPPVTPEEPTPPVTPEEPKPPVEESKPDFTVTDFKMDGIVYNIASNDTLNIREYPDASSKLVTSVPNNTRVNVTGKTSNNWYRLDIDGKVGYANSKYIKEYVPETTKYKVIKENINLRLSPSWGGEVYQMVRVGEELDVISINGGWASVYKDKKIVYAPADYLSNSTEPSTPEDKPDTPSGSVVFTQYPYTLKEYIKVQSDKNPKYDEDYFETYVNPLKCNPFEFLRLDKFRNVNVTQLNAMLSEQNSGVLIGKGQAFINTAKKFNIDPLYFVSQSLHETGYGKSTLAKGVTISEIANTDKPIKDSNGNITGYEMIRLSSPVTVYNLFGIGAQDNLPTMPNRALVLGTTYAYNKGWTSVEKAIDGAGEFVSKNYINSSKYNQNTMYKIRFNQSSTYIWHQYATTPWYSRDIAKLIEKYQYMYTNDNLTFDKPLFKGMSEYSLSSTRSIDIKDNHPVGREDITLQ